MPWLLHFLYDDTQLEDLQTKEILDFKIKKGVLSIDFKRLPNTIQYNKNTDKHYLCIYPIAKGRNTKVRYTVVTPQGTYSDNDFDRGLVIESYFNRKNNGVSKMMKIDTENIIKIGG